MTCNDHKSLSPHRAIKTMSTNNRNVSKSLELVALTFFSLLAFGTVATLQPQRLGYNDAKEIFFEKHCNVWPD